LTGDTDVCRLDAKITGADVVTPRRIFPVTLALALFCLLPVPPTAGAEDDTAPATAGAESEKKRSFSTGTAFFDKAALSGGLYYFQRDRKRYDAVSGGYAVNLAHATLQANLDFVSGFPGDTVGLDFALFGSTDVHNIGAVDHEMGFVPWGDPWHPDWSKKRTDDGVSIYKAAVKAKSGAFWGRAGYIQPSGPGVLGVNWSIMPGTYRGVNAGADFGALSIAAAWADEYKSPWFTRANAFRKNDGESHVPWLWSIGARYGFTSGFSVEAAYGESVRHLKNAHIKGLYTAERAGGKGRLSLGYHLYAMDDSDDSGMSPNDNFAGIASQHYLFGRFDTDLWTVKLEGAHTRAPVNSAVQAGYFAYRLTDRNGSSKGAYEAWWDARSDWNAHNETAVYLGMERRLDDLLPLPGFSLGMGAALGWDGKAYGYSEHLKEWAFNVDIGYCKPDAPWQGAFVKLHYTEYKNGSSQPSWEAYKNAFQDEHDIKLFMGILFDL
jgi:hypothetical protein